MEEMKQFFLSRILQLIKYGVMYLSSIRPFMSLTKDRKSTRNPCISGRYITLIPNEKYDLEMKVCNMNTNGFPNNRFEKY